MLYSDEYSEYNERGVFTMDQQSLFTCPNPKCKNHSNTEGKWFIRKGSYKQKWSQEKIPRFQCKNCSHKFSKTVFIDTYKQHKPYLNKMIYKWYTNSASQRQIAENVFTTRTTVTRKFRFLADKARRIHAFKILTGKFKTREIQFDEQETFLRTKQLPLSIAIAVDGSRRTRKKGGGKIIDIAVGTMPVKGKLTAKSQEKYGIQKDERSFICQTVMNNVKLATGGLIIITTDAKPAYKTYVSRVLPRATHFKCSRSEEKEEKEYISRGDEDFLWYINQACAANRHDISRLRRSTCVTTKDIHELRRHLWLYVAHRNGYERDLFNPLYDSIKFQNLKNTVNNVLWDLEKNSSRQETQNHVMLLTEKE